MTRTTNARIAGFTYLFYAAIGICSELLMHHARGGGERSPDLNPADFSEPTLFSKVKEKAARESGLSFCDAFVTLPPGFFWVCPKVVDLTNRNVKSRRLRP